MDEICHDAGLQDVAALIARRAGFGFGDARQKVFNEVVAAEMARLGVSGPERLLEILESSPGALDDLVERLTVPESYFFRDPQQLELLRTEVLPEIARRRGAAHQPRLLSAGCAAGEEPYSIAIVLEEAGIGDRSSIVGADIATASLARAARATYGDWSFRGMPDATRWRYFELARGGWRLIERIRTRVELIRINLADDSCSSIATTGFDVIFCRNALIYFTPEAIGEVARRLFAMLVDGGWLFTAPADPLLDSHAPFEVVIGRAGIVYRRPLVARELGLDGIAPIVEAAPLDQVRGADDSPTTPLAVTSVLSRPATAAPAAGGGKTAAAHALLQAQQLGNRGHLADALKAAEWAVQVHPSSAEAHYVRALLLTEAGHDRDAAATFRRALYFRGDFALAALGLGLTLGRLGDVAGARQALRRARSILSRCAPDALVDFGEGERVAGLISTVDVQLADLEARR